MVTTDLDGTLLNHARAVSDTDRATLAELGDQGVIRVVATGRSLFSACRVLTTDLPIDYLVYSSGSGAVRWPGREPVFAHDMHPDSVMQAIDVLTHLRCDFMVQHAAPDTHRFAWQASSGRDNPDFERRLAVYADHAQPLRSARPGFHVSQFVCVHPERDGVEMWSRVRAALPGLNVARATSPLDGRSVWIEIYPPEVSKASGCAWLARAHGIEVSDVLGVGNDYNDLDLLEWAGFSCVVENSPPALRDRFHVVASHRDSGFSDSVRQWRARQRG